MAELVTKPALAAVREEAAAMKRDLLASDASTRRELEAAMDTLCLRLTVRLGIMMAAGLSLMTAILSAVIRFH